MEEKFDEIMQALKDKACLKQSIYRTTLSVFQTIKDHASALAGELADRFKSIDSSVIIEFKDINEFEFHLKFSGDLLIFTMHSNVITFPEEHLLINNAYVKEDDSRGYFGHIMVYNFMADSVKYNRLSDAGYLVARMLLNKESHFYFEGVRQLNFLHPSLAQNILTDALLREFIESAMLAAIGNDLIGPNYHDIQVIQLGAKQANQMVSAGKKFGFQMSYDKEN